ncbi:MAG: tripartite tricarboxylate transporter substrate binding protein [Burkholderiaceae bacterium]
MMRRRTMAKLAVLGAATLFCTAAVAQQSASAYPSKIIRLIVPFAPGGQTDLLARLVGQRIHEKLGQQVIVENRPGGNTLIGTDFVARAAPDGYTLLLAGSTHVITPMLTPAPFDPIKDFAPIATLTSSAMVLAATPSLAANNVRELVQLARSRPGQLNFASYGTGSPSHLGGELFNMLSELKMQHIPYKGAMPAVTELIGGQVQLFLVPPAPVAPHVKTGKLKALAVTGDSRLAALPDVPTFTEAGMPNFDVKVWLGLFAPAGTPPEIVNRLSAEMSALLAQAETRQTLAAQGIEAWYTTPEQFGALMKSDMAKYQSVIRTANIKAD